ncbi:MAG: hypothetical protein NXI04_07985 [Planctomycetaceae bacterium]|nr:hypothetical protein [Planctomycetaceae bacterium]
MKRSFFPAALMVPLIAIPIAIASTASAAGDVMAAPPSPDWGSLSVTAPVFPPSVRQERIQKRRLPRPAGAPAESSLAVSPAPPVRLNRLSTPANITQSAGQVTTWFAAGICSLLAIVVALLIDALRPAPSDKRLTLTPDDTQLPSLTPTAVAVEQSAADANELSTANDRAPQRPPRIYRFDPQVLTTADGASVLVTCRLIVERPPGAVQSMPDANVFSWYLRWAVSTSNSTQAQSSEDHVSKQMMRLAEAEFLLKGIVIRTIQTTVTAVASSRPSTPVHPEQMIKELCAN